MSLRFTAVAAAFLVAVAAPAARAQFSMGPRVGLNLARFRVSPGLDEQHRLRPAAQVGVAAQVRMGRWALQPAFVFSQKGSVRRYTVDVTLPQGQRVVYQEKQTTRVPYLELPIHLAYTPRWARGVQVFAGPYVAVGIGGHMELTPESDNAPERTRYPISYPTLFGGGYSFRWQDVGLNAGLGYQHQRLLVQLQQSFGGTNVWPVRDAGQEIGGRYHRVTSLTLTYLFGPKPQPDFMLD
ncbi:PorT family protein [Hymenobacter gummosus]|uniref:PorT family protein n=1 Tax=Hymenobacter gummosus TaxID=1776032 RepID=A0A3S0K4R1_9BACT|nr:porin family protein [Hymenobacter gummosus]RTQ49151.1 PorT family protein [Hymenobacter gummosus]